VYLLDPRGVHAVTVGKMPQSRQQLPRGRSASSTVLETHLAAGASKAFPRKRSPGLLAASVPRGRPAGPRLPSFLRRRVDPEPATVSLTFWRDFSPR
jgi:hypothetical protein